MKHYIHLWSVVAIGLLISGVMWIACEPQTANAEHDMVYAPCDPEDTRPIQEQVWYIDYQTGNALKYNDPFWGESPSVYTNWRHQCLLGMSGVWQAIPIIPLDHPPTHQVETRVTTTTTPSPTTTNTIEELTFDGGTSINITDIDVVPVILAPVYEEPSSSWIERWFEAEWDDFPFKATIELLEERYPPNTPNKYHFRLSVAVEFLKQGGKLKGLDNVWNS
jgi:hypothetical protein